MVLCFLFFCTVFSQNTASSDYPKYHSYLRLFKKTSCDIFVLKTTQFPIVIFCHNAYRDKKAKKIQHSYFCFQTQLIYSFSRVPFLTEFLTLFKFNTFLFSKSDALVGIMTQFSIMLVFVIYCVFTREINLQDIKRFRE